MNNKKSFSFFEKLWKRRLDNLGITYTYMDIYPLVVRDFLTQGMINTYYTNQPD